MGTSNKGNGRSKVASKNTGTTDMSVSEAAASFDSVEEFSSWLDANPVERTINKVKTMVRPTCSLSANVPDDIYYDFIQTAKEEDELKDGGLTYAVRYAIWTALGKDAEYPEWAKTEAARISSERSERMRGAGTERAAKVRSLESENTSMRAELDELKAMLAAMQKAS